MKYFAEEQPLINPVASSSFPSGSSFEGHGGISGYLLSHLTKPEMRSARREGARLDSLSVRCLSSYLFLPIFW
jgi:hypothetical protein